MVWFKFKHTRLLHDDDEYSPVSYPTPRHLGRVCFGFDGHCVGSVPSEDAETWIMHTYLTLTLKLQYLNLRYNKKEYRDQELKVEKNKNRTISPYTR